MNPLLKANNLKKEFRHPRRVPVLEDVSLTLGKGEALAIRGASGEGKSTLLHILGTLEPPCAGRLWISGMEATSFNAARLRCLHIGFLFQSFFLLEEESALANVLAPARIAGRSVKPGSESHERGLHLLEMTGMTHRSDFPVKYLSGGEKQRIGLARALGNNPDILLADEPTGNLDDATAAAIYALMWEATIAQGKGLIVVTHDKRLSDRCDRTLFLHKGRLYPNQEF